LTKRKDKEEGDSSPFQQVEFETIYQKKIITFEEVQKKISTSLFVERTTKRGERVC
jgi:hypothetical protein